MLEKSEIRSNIKSLRKSLTEAETRGWDEAVYQKLIRHPDIAVADCVYTYLSFGRETDTRKLIEWLWSRNQAVAVPRVMGQEMAFFEIRSMKDLKRGCMGIPEPINNCPHASNPKAVCIVPGLAFGPDGARTGYGGGYYDRFFDREPRHKKLGIAYDFQITETLKQEPFDQRVDEILTPEHHYICKEERL